MTATHRKVPSSRANHNCRQRKKLHIGEHKQVALVLQVQIIPGLTNLACMEFVDRLVIEVLDKRDLNGFGIISEFFSIMSNNGTVTQDDVEVIRQWLKQQPEVLGATGEIRDAWYS